MDVSTTELEVLTDPRERFLKEVVLEVEKEYGKKEAQRVVKALSYADIIHGKKERVGGGLFVNHPIEVARRLWKIKKDVNLVMAGLLHDTVEDHEGEDREFEFEGDSVNKIVKVSRKMIREEFGDEVAEIIEGVTKVVVKGQTDHKKTIQKFFGMASLNENIALLKIVDRLHNLETINKLTKNKRIQKAEETLSVYVPMAKALREDALAEKLIALSSVHVDKDAQRQLDVEGIIAGAQKKREKNWL